MSVTTEKASTSEPQVTAARFRDRLRRRLLADKTAKRLVVLGGLAIIFSILAIFLVILAEVFPLFRKAQAHPAASPSANLQTRPWMLGADEYQEFAYFLAATGEFRFLPLLPDGVQPPAPVRVSGLDGAKIASAASGMMGRGAVGSSDGRVMPFAVSFVSEFRENKRFLRPSVQFSQPVAVDLEKHRPIQALAYGAGDKGEVAAALVAPDEVVVHATRERKGLLGGGEMRAERHVLQLAPGTKLRTLLLDNRGEDLFLGTEDGKILHYSINDEGTPEYGGAVEAGSRAGASITALAFLIGDRTLVVGDSAGAVSTWQIEQYGGEQRRIQKMRDFSPHREAVVAISASWRDKGFLTADASGHIQLHYGTTGDTLLELQGPAGLTTAIVSPKADGILAADAQGGLARWSLENPHPETSVGSLFGKIWYEGYSRPEFVWQSTGGSDDFEAKFSLMPLIFGTLKGTLYALLFAVPIALLAALFTSQFLHPRLRNVVKPTIEIMAALPSVVLGFLAGLWIAPNIEKIVPGIFLAPVVVSLAVLVALGLWRTLPLSLRGRFHVGSELFLLLPVVLIGCWISFQLGYALEAAAMHGDYRSWLQQAFGLTYDQRNSLVVGFAMGFAVIPIIFTIAEDSLSNVPQHLTAGSLALGATRWQTALRIVLPTASPGIFSAIMIGFGRAVGETMIVLMATGNTPIMDLSIFSGFRALSANIAVELPEAPEGGTLYRVLFLAALLLFALTFVVNTVAEIVRLKLRKKYRYL